MAGLVVSGRVGGNDIATSPLLSVLLKLHHDLFWCVESQTELPTYPATIISLLGAVMYIL